MVMVIFLYVTRYGAYNEGPKPDLYIMLVTYYFNEVSVVNGKRQWRHQLWGTGARAPPGACASCNFYLARL